MSEQIKEFGDIEQSHDEEVDTDTFYDTDDFEIPTDNILDSLVADLSNRPDEEKRWYKVSPEMDIECEFALPTDFTEVQSWFKAATVKKGKRQSLDINKLGLIIMSNQSRGIRFRGQTVTDDAGKPIRLSSNFLWSKFSTEHRKINSTQQMIKFLYKTDGRIMSTGQTILNDAGFSGDVEDGDGEEPGFSEG